MTTSDFLTWGFCRVPLYRWITLSEQRLFGDRICISRSYLGSDLMLLTKPVHVLSPFVALQINYFSST